MPDKKPGKGMKQAGSKDAGSKDAGKGTSSETGKGSGSTFKDDPKQASEAGKKGGASKGSLLVFDQPVEGEPI